MSGSGIADESANPTRVAAEDASQEMAAYKRAVSSLPVLGLLVQLGTPIAGNDLPGAVVRGAIGNALRLHGCPNRGEGEEPCPPGSGCAYCLLFETTPAKTAAGWTSTQRRAPHPWVIRGSEAMWAAGVFEIRLFGEATRLWAPLVGGLRLACERGLGESRRSTRLASVRGLTVAELASPSFGTTEIAAIDGSGIEPVEAGHVVDRMVSGCEGADAVAVRALSPLRLPRREVYLERPDAAAIAASGLRRVAAMASLSDPALVLPPPRATLALLQEARVIRDSWTWRDASRYSTRQERYQLMGGALGEVVLTEVRGPGLDALALSALVGVGKATNFGLGAMTLGPAGEEGA